MAYVTVPKDLTKIKSKVMFNLTKRQLICFSAAVAIGLPLFFLVKDSVGTTTAALCMVLAMLPMFLLAMYEKNGQPLEVIIRQFVEVKFLRPKERPYQTNNFYAALALRGDGWYLRSSIIWHKTNPMPESTRDRPTRCYEYVFLLTKSKKYY